MRLERAARRLAAERANKRWFTASTLAAHHFQLGSSDVTFASVLLCSTFALLLPGKNDRPAIVGMVWHQPLRHMQVLQSIRVEQPGIKAAAVSWPLCQGSSSTFPAVWW